MPGRLRACFTGEGAAWVSSAFNGNGHAGYGAHGADFKVLLWAEFDWVGRRIGNWRPGQAVGPSHRLIHTSGALTPDCRQTAVARDLGTVRPVGGDGFA